MIINNNSTISESSQDITDDREEGGVGSDNLASVITTNNGTRTQRGSTGIGSRLGAATALAVSIISSLVNEASASDNTTTSTIASGSIVTTANATTVSPTSRSTLTLHDFLAFIGVFMFFILFAVMLRKFINNREERPRQPRDVNNNIIIQNRRNGNNDLERGNDD